MRAMMLAAALITAIPTFTDAEAPPPPILAMGLCASGGGDIVDDKPAAKVALLSGYGQAGMVIRTASPQAQAYFDNGLELAHAFAHKGGYAAFEEAVRLDPKCAMCLWGQAWAGGPTINFTIDAKDQAEMAALVARAEPLAADGPPLERQMIAALKLRYQHGGGGGSGDLAFAQAMDDLARAHPEDDTLAVLAADAWMIPASLRDKKEHLPRAVGLLETVLKRSPNDAAAIHFYIHATEMSGFGARAEPYADRLESLAPSASHLTHMPSHTFYWVGRYEDAYKSNASAARLDVANAQAQGLTGPGAAFKLNYHAHNVRFGVGGAMMSGDGDGALALTRELVTLVPGLKPDQVWPQMVAGDGFAAQGRYADPDAVLALPDPGDKLPYVQAMWRYGRGEALSRRGDAAGVRREAAVVRLSAFRLRAFGDRAKFAASVTEVASLVLEGRAAMLDNQPKVAAKAFRKAADLEEKRFATMTDPPTWWYPVRRSQAAALLAQGDTQGAVNAAKIALLHRPLDPISLNILAQAERAQGQSAQADTHLAQARKGWAGDLSKVTLAQS
ncbi:hypothetical protein BH10PSE4_BH10PSE4_47240 [soil metagenome]